MGAGATLLIDLWALFLRRTFGVGSLNLCLLGRWVLHLPKGRVIHANITTAAPQPHECATGWTTHYLIGIGFAVLFTQLASTSWTVHPTLLPALGFGISTVIVPFLTIQPAFGLGIASSRTPHPSAARLRSLMTHTVFGLGLYIWGVLLSHLPLAR
jgi:hypothetical protein